MANIRSHLPDGKTFVSFDGKTYHTSDMGNQLASPLEIALYRQPRRVLEGYRDEG